MDKEIVEKKTVDGEKAAVAVKSIVASAFYWRVAIARALLYMALTMIATFLGLTETFSDNTWSQMGFFLKIRIALACFVSGGTALIAFLDSTSQALREQAKYAQAKPGEKPPVESAMSTGHTAFITKG